MSNKDAAQRMRTLADTEVMNAETRRSLWAIADELDPPKLRPAPGTIVWWRIKGELDWMLAQVLPKNCVRTIDGLFDYSLDDPDIEWKFARILEP